MKLKVKKQLKVKNQPVIEVIEDIDSPEQHEIYVREKIRRRYKKGHLQGDPVHLIEREHPVALENDREIEIDWRKLRGAVKKVKAMKGPKRQTIVRHKPKSHGSYTLPHYDTDFFSNHYTVPSKEYTTKIPAQSAWQSKHSKFMVLDSDTGRTISEHRTRSAAERVARKQKQATQIYERH